MKFKRSVYITLALIPCISLSAATQSAQSVIKEMQGRYKNIVDFESEFTQIRAWNFSGVSDTLTGTMKHMKEDFFRIEGELFVISTDGRVVRDYDIPKEQMLIDYLEDSDESFSIKTYMFDFPDRFYPVDFRKEERNGRPGFFVALEPKKPEEESFLMLNIWIDAADYIVREAHAVDYEDNDTIYILKNFRTNTGLTAEAFDVNPPANVKIIDLTGR